MEKSKKIIKKPSFIFILFAVFTIGLNLRPGITSMAFVVSDIQNEFNINSSITGMLTTTPILVFVFISLRIPKFGIRFGLTKSLLLSLLILFVGFLIRLIPSLFFIFLGMAVIGVAIAIGNVLLPAYIKEYFKEKSGILTGIYSVSIYAGTAIAGAFTATLTDKFGSWRFSLFFWSILILLALPFWLKLALNPIKHNQNSTFYSAKPIHFKTLLSNKLAWSISIYFAVLSLLFFTTSAWLPTILIDNGSTSANAAKLFTFINISAIPFTLITSIIVFKLKQQIWVTVLGPSLLFTGILGLYVSSGSILWFFAIIFGMGHGVTTGTSFSLPLLRTKDGTTTASLNAFSQTFAYSFSSTGPITAGIFHDITNSWLPLIVFLLVIILVQIFAGFVAGKNRFVEDM